MFRRPLSAKVFKTLLRLTGQMKQRTKRFACQNSIYINFRRFLLAFPSAWNPTHLCWILWQDPNSVKRNVSIVLISIVYQCA